MSVKHLKRQYESVCNTYHEMLDNLRDIEEISKDTPVDEAIIEQVQKSIEPVKASYETWSYVMFLLNKPNKKEKEKKYNRQFKEPKVTSFEKSKESVENIRKIKEEI